MYQMVKRLLDVVLALLLLVVLSPILALCLALVYVLDGPPVLFRQTRAGQAGKPFTILKLRTVAGHHDRDRPEDSLTRSGKFLRRFALDELPQLINIIRGDMSLIGPRPILMDEAEGYNDHQRRRLLVKPGLTGWAQVNGRNSLDWTGRIEHDLWYVDNLSLFVDLLILLKTPWAVFSPAGVYGPGNYNPTTTDVEEGQRT